MTKNAHLLESIINITEERDKKILTRSLLEVLSELIHFDLLTFLNKPRRSCGEYLEITASHPRNAFRNIYEPLLHGTTERQVKTDKSMAQCLNKATIVKAATQNGLIRKTYPIIVNNDVMAILDTYGHEHTEYEEKLITSIIRIYSNFVAVVIDNELDTLTGLLNRKTFDSQLSKLLLPDATKPFDDSYNDCRIKNRDIHHWLGVLDIDHFKSINDKFGHIYGDEVLLLFAEQMKKSLRSNDLLFRYGGEEFVVVLTNTTESDAMMVFDQFRQQIESMRFPQVGKVTVSIGVVKAEKQSHTATLLEYADKALYYAKENGRNQVCSYFELIRSGLLEIRKIESAIELF